MRFFIWEFKVKKITALLLFLILFGYVRYCYPQNAQECENITPLSNEQGQQVGRVCAKRNKDGSIVGKIYTVTGSYSGYYYTYLKEDQWYTDLYDTDGKLVSRIKGVPEFFKYFFRKNEEETETSE